MTQMCIYSHDLWQVMQTYIFFLKHNVPLEIKELLSPCVLCMSCANHLNPSLLLSRSGFFNWWTIRHVDMNIDFSVLGRQTVMFTIDMKLSYWLPWKHALMIRWRLESGSVLLYGLMTLWLVKVDLFFTERLPKLGENILRRFSVIMGHS